MGRLPCCDKLGLKKGPWTPEEDLILVSYVQQNGPSNWRAVPTNTGLLRCSKSCRLRWTNYLRPGIKRGNFTEPEEKMIIHLQALLGNRWAAIAAYLPQRTDNDIKNFWNTHLKKRIGVQSQGALSPGASTSSSSSKQRDFKGQWEMKLQTDVQTAKQAFCDAISPLQPPILSQPQPQPSTYAASTENIARLLPAFIKNMGSMKSLTGASSETTTTQNSYVLNPTNGYYNNHDQGFDHWINNSLLSGFNNHKNSSSSTPEDGSSTVADQNYPRTIVNYDLTATSASAAPAAAAPLSYLDKWLIEDNAQVLQGINVGDDGHGDLMENMAFANGFF